MSLQTTPQAFLDYNTLQTKNVVVVVDIDGLDLLTTRPIFQKIRYGDPINYGDPGVAYGGLRAVGLDPSERQQRDLLSLDGGSTTIQQKLEPEQGRASISTISMSFIDKDMYMTQAISPGIIVDEILGREVKIWFGYVQNSFPEDYYVIWRGRITQINVDPGRVTLQFSDPNVGKRQEIFYSAKTQVSSAIGSGDTTINVVSNGDFHKKITGPDGTYNTDFKMYAKIEDEFIEYQQVGSEAIGFGTNVFTNVLRGQRGTAAVAHGVGKDVQCFLELSGHAIDITLRLMLSGWGSFYKYSVDVQAFRYTGDPSNPDVFNAIVLPTAVDAVRDYGLQPGDYISVSGSSIPGNNGTCIVQGFQESLDYPNRLILVDKTFTSETTTPALLALRSQYDVYPTTCGVKLAPIEVDVGTHIYYKNTFLGPAENSYRFLLSDKVSCKTFIESEIMLPIGAYCITRQGKLSMGLTKPPIADQRTVYLDFNNVIEPNTIKPVRGTNNRKFFNEIQWSYDKSDDGTYANVRRTLDSESLSLIRLSSVLPITSSGSRTDLGFDDIVTRRERFLLNRYKRGAIIYQVKTNFGIGNQIEAGDVIILADNGELKITNMNSGERDLGVELYEVIDRSLDIKTGMISLSLQGGIGSNIDDRFATISPSSLVDYGSTTTSVRIKESFGEIFPGREFDKWTDYVGLKIIIHSTDYTTRYAEKIFTGFSSSDVRAMQLDSALTFVPQPGDVVDIAMYPTNTDPNDQATYKLVHTFLDLPIPVLTGISDTQFTFNFSLYGNYLQVGQLIYVYEGTLYAQMSPEVKITDITGPIITVESSLQFMPNSTHRIGLAGFDDGGGSYRFI